MNDLVSMEDNDDSNLIDMIIEYLHFEGFDSSAEALKEEQTSHRNENKKSRNVQMENLLFRFDSGDSEGFFALWDEQVPTEQASSPKGSRLIFYLRIYFAIFPLHPISHIASNEESRKARASSSMQAFRVFLETQGGNLAQTPEFLPFYALPFVPDPAQHPSFQNLFENYWVEDCRCNLQEFLNASLPAPAVPRLLTLVQKSETVPVQKGRDVLVEASRAFMEQHCTLLSRLEGLSRRRSQVPLDLLSGARDRYTAFMNLIEAQTTSGSSGHQQPKEQEIDNKNQPEKSYQPIKNQIPLPLELEGSDNSLPMRESNGSSERMQKQVVPGAEFSSSPAEFSPGEPHPERARVTARSQEDMQPQTGQLDFNKVKQDLSSLSATHKFVLLQALRHRLSRCKLGGQRRSALQSYIDADLLLCSADGSAASVDPHTDLLSALLRSDDAAVRAASVRFINTIATDSFGRTYLLLHRRLIALLCVTLTLEKSDTDVHQNALGALQKFSLRRQPQADMIELGIIEYLVRILSNIENLSEYSTEYGTALLMNLSLRKMGKERAESSHVEILSVLTDLLEHENPQVRTYINGTLYSVLTRPALKERARSIGMETMLSYLMERSNEQYRRQIAYILQQLESDAEEEDGISDGNDADESDADFDDDEELDDFEEDDEFGDRDGSGLRGEQLLFAEYLVDQKPMNTATLENRGRDRLDGSISRFDTA